MKHTFLGKVTVAQLVKNYGNESSGDFFTAERRLSSMRSFVFSSHTIANGAVEAFSTATYWIDKRF